MGDNHWRKPLRSPEEGKRLSEQLAKGEIGLVWLRNRIMATGRAIKERGRRAIRRLRAKDQTPNI